MHTVILSVHVKEEYIADFIAETIKNVQGSLREPEVQRFDFLQSKDDPARFTLIEVYDNEQSISKHTQTAHYTTWRDAVTDMMAETRTKAAYRMVSPQESNP